MKKRITLKAMLIAICFSLQFNVMAQTKSFTVHVQTAGTLQQLLFDADMLDVTDLTVTGSLNGLDIKIIREMVGADYRLGELKCLDMSGATIVSGGGDLL